MSLFPRMTPFHYPLRTTHRDELSPFFSLFNDTFNELQRLSDNLPATQSGSSGGFFAPKFDVKETPQAYELQGELPGIAQKDISIEFADENTLTIKGRTEHRREQGTKPGPGDQQQQQQIDQPDAVKAADNSGAKSNTELTNTPSADKQQLSKPSNDKNHTYWVSERSVGEFSRSFSFPNKVDQEHVTASLKHGILSVVVPKMSKQAPKTRRITVEADD